jgi:hypothetical protein
MSKFVIGISSVGKLQKKKGLASAEAAPSRPVNFQADYVILVSLRPAVVTRLSNYRHVFEGPKLKMGRQPRSGDTSLAIGPFDPDWDRR